MPHSGNIGTNVTGAHMKIGILGAGNIGATLARALSAAGHTVLLANSRGPDTIGDLAGEAGGTRRFRRPGPLVRGSGRQRRFAADLAGRSHHAGRGARARSTGALGWLLRGLKKRA